MLDSLRPKFAFGFGSFIIAWPLYLLAENASELRSVRPELVGRVFNILHGNMSTQVILFAAAKCYSNLVRKHISRAEEKPKK